MSDSQNKPPVEKCSQYPLDAAIWENQGRDGDTYYNVSLTRTYTVTDPDTGEKTYHRTTQLRKQDLLLAGELLRLAWYKIRALEDAQ